MEGEGEAGKKRGRKDEVRKEEGRASNQGKEGVTVIGEEGRVKAEGRIEGRKYR